MLPPVYTGTLVVSWTRSANSKAHVCVEIQIPQQRPAMEPIIMSICSSFGSRDIQIFLEDFGIGAMGISRLCSIVSRQGIRVRTFGVSIVMQDVVFCG